MKETGTEKKKPYQKPELRVIEMKEDEVMCVLPVVILSSSDANRDIKASYAGHANCYVTKPADFDGFVKAVHAIEHFWTTVARLPNHD